MPIPFFQIDWVLQGELALGPAALGMVPAAGVERSPLVCMAWMMRERGRDRLQALDYLMQVHPGTSPLPGQLRILDGWSADRRQCS